MVAEVRLTDLYICASFWDWLPCSLEKRTKVLPVLTAVTGTAWVLVAPAVQVGLRCWTVIPDGYSTR